MGVAVLSAILGGTVFAALDFTKFELDKNASNDQATKRLALLAANINATQTSINVCQIGATNPSAGNILLVEAERMTVVSAATGSFGGNCGANVKRTYVVSRGAGGTTAASHQASGVPGYVTLITESSTAGPDWNQVHAAVVADPNTKCLSLGLVECSFVFDDIGPSIFIGGASKDHLPIDGWSHTSGSSPDKAEIINAYAAKAISGNDQLLYFGADRYAVDGSTDFGFWFFRNPVVANADGTFTGTHVGTMTTPGDILILGTFTQGGAASNVRVFRWVGTGGNESGTVNGPDAAFGDCIGAAADAKGCATVNNTTIDVPWTHTTKGASVGGWIPAGGFLEGAVNLTDIGLAGCFSSFLAETRSSPEITAILKDFTLGSFEACGSTMVTTPADSTGAALGDSDEDDLPDISIGTGSVGVRDTADLDITGVSEFDGTLRFYICGPIATGTCDGTTNVGTEVGSAQTIDETVTPLQSAVKTITEVGRYCWRATFTSATTGVPNASDSSAGECFEVLPVTPQISTSATASVEILTAIDDTATLAGTATKPNGDPAGGTITFNVYGPDDTDCSEAAVYTSVVNVAGNGTYDASDGSGGEFVPASAGTYNWVASYSGDNPNTLSASGACGDTGETSEVTPKTPAIVTQATTGNVPLGDPIDDVATLSGTVAQPDGDPAGGTITFTAYGPDDADCDGGAVYTSVVNVSGNGNYTASTGTGGSFTPTAAGTYYWIASYSGDLPNTTSVSGACGDPNESSIVISLQPTIGTVQSFVPNDAATITVAAGGGNLAGSVVFKLYVDDADCSGTAAYTSSAINITSGTGTGLSRTVLSANTTAYGATGTTFHWVVEYTSTNAAHENVTSACGVEHSSIVVANDDTP